MLKCEVCQILFFVFFVWVCDLNAKAFWWDGPDKVIWPSVSAIFVLLTCTCMCIVCMRWSIFRDTVHWYYTVIQSQPSSTCCNNSFMCVLDFYKSFFPVYMCISVRKVFLYTSSNLYMHISKSAEIPSVLTVTSIYKSSHFYITLFKRFLYIVLLLTLIIMPLF